MPQNAQVYGRRNRRAVYVPPPTTESSPSDVGVGSPPKTHRRLKPLPLLPRRKVSVSPRKPKSQPIDAVEVLEVASELEKLNIRQSAESEARDGSARLDDPIFDDGASSTALRVRSINTCAGGQRTKFAGVETKPRRPDVSLRRRKGDQQCELSNSLSIAITSDVQVSIDEEPKVKVSKLKAKRQPRHRLSHHDSPTRQHPSIVESIASDNRFCPKNIYETHCEPLLNLCGHKIERYDTWAEEVASHFAIKKFAEASFGEVYRLSLLETLPEFSHNDESVIKIIALRPPLDKIPSGKRQRTKALEKASAMSSPEDVTTEVRLLQRMMAIPGFTNFREARIVQGRPPLPFIEAFHAFNIAQASRGKEVSIFPDPGDQLSYDDDQLWAVIEMQDAGIDLERCVEDGICRDIWSVWDIFWQAALALAKGEEAAEFEHRDLHLGNLCIQAAEGACSSSPKKGKKSNRQKRTIDTKRKLNFTNIDTTLIDYTLSRARMLDDNIAHVDLSRDEGLFTADASEEYQYELYRYMRGALLLDEPTADFDLANTARRARQAAKHRSWEQFHPITNLLWLHFILFKLLDQVDWTTSQEDLPPKTQRKKRATWKRAFQLEQALLCVRDLLDPASVCQGDVKRAGDLIGVALNEGWLDVQDVTGGEDGVADVS